MGEKNCGSIAIIVTRPQLPILRVCSIRATVLPSMLEA